MVVKEIEGPIKITTPERDVFFRCPDCEGDVDETGMCEESAEPCYYCTESCQKCGRGFCDQSC